MSGMTMFEAKRLSHEGEFDLIILALHGQPEKAIAYSDQLTRTKPLLPVLLLTDSGVYGPPGTLRAGVLKREIRRP